MIPTSRCKQHYQVRTVFPEGVTPAMLVEQVAPLLIAFMLPKARELIAKRQAERDRELGIPEYVSEGL